MKLISFAADKRVADWMKWQTWQDGWRLLLLQRLSVVVQLLFLLDQRRKVHVHLVAFLWQRQKKTKFPFFQKGAQPPRRDHLVNWTTASVGHGFSTGGGWGWWADNGWKVVTWSAHPPGHPTPVPKSPKRLKLHDSLEKKGRKFNSFLF